MQKKKGHKYVSKHKRHKVSVEELSQAKEEDVLNSTLTKRGVEGRSEADRRSIVSAMGLNKRDVLEIIYDSGCIHPLQGLAELARDAHAEDDKKLAFDCYKELAQYVAPKRKAIEHSVEDPNSNQPLVIIMPSTTPPPSPDDAEDGELVG